MSEEKIGFTEAYRDVYEDTLFFLNNITSEYDFYPDVLNVLRNGDMSIDLKKRYTEKAIDELWVKTIEESLTALDTMIRNPSKFIEENEKVLPIELSRNISSRSIVHLAQHTDYISKIDGDDITPSKILNVFRDETLLTYENKFVNTLIDRLYLFVAKRYTVINNDISNERSTNLTFTGSFVHGSVKGKLTFGMELSDAPEFGRLGGSFSLTERVKRLYSIVRSYTESSFVKEMGKNFVRPPIMRTNAISKNKNLRQCLALWEFIESYEGTGLEIALREDAERIDEEYISELYATCALQYMFFRYKIRNGFVEENTLDSETVSEPLLPRFNTKVESVKASEFDMFDTRFVKTSMLGNGNTKKLPLNLIRKVSHAVDVALVADDLNIKRRLEKAALLKKQEEEMAKQAMLDAIKAEKLRLKQEEDKNKERKRLLNRIPRKEKKRIRMLAEEKARAEGVVLPSVFDYEEYKRFLENGKG